VTNPDVTAAAARFLAKQLENAERNLEELEHRCVKRRFTSDREARNRMHDIQERATEARVPIRAYKCPTCFGWHLTSKPLDSSGKVWKAKNK
jgi:hypothetical protein